MLRKKGLDLTLIYLHKEPEDCSICKNGISVVFKDLATDAVEFEEQLLESRVCPLWTWTDPEACKIGISMFWKLIAGIVFSEKSVPLMCNAINPECEVPSMRLK